MNIDDLIDDRKYELHWQMTRPERLAMQQTLSALKPKLSIEIGTYKGGSLQVIAEHSDRVISLDISPDLESEFGTRFPNAEFVTGHSQDTLPVIVDNLNRTGESPDFVLIDGDHSADGVRRDVNSVLQIQPQRPMVIFMHDTFNPDCRQGMITANWSDCPYVHSVDIDFIPGLFSEGSFDTAEAGSMWSGLGCAVLSPEKRRDELVIRQSQRRVVEAVTEISVHNSSQRPHNKTSSTGLLRSLIRRLKRRLG